MAMLVQDTSLCGGLETENLEYLPESAYLPRLGIFPCS